MEIKSGDTAGHSSGTHDPRFKRVIVAANARPEAYKGMWPEGWYPHPQLFFVFSEQPY